MLCCPAWCLFICVLFCCSIARLLYVPLRCYDITLRDTFLLLLLLLLLVIAYVVLCCFVLIGAALFCVVLK